MEQQIRRYRRLVHNISNIALDLHSYAERAGMLPDWAVDEAGVEALQDLWASMQMAVHTLEELEEQEDWRVEEMGR